MGLNARCAGMWLAMVLVTSGAIILAPSIAVAQHLIGNASSTRDFLRFKAKYTVKATGEVIQFDLVRPCRTIYAKDFANDSMWLPPGPVAPSDYFTDIKFFPKVTEDHHAIVVHIPQICRPVYVDKNNDYRIDLTVGERSREVMPSTSNGLVPKDLLPYATWFENADDLRFGWQYASPDAYASPLAKIRFEGASIEDATAEEFQQWKKNAAQGFRPSKIIAHPYGFSYAQVQNRVLDNDGIPVIPTGCWGVRRLRLLDDVRELAKRVWPADHPRFWTIDAVAPEHQADAKLLFRRVFGDLSFHTVFEDGLQRGRYGGGESSPTETSGTVYEPANKPPTEFPAPYNPLLFESVQASDLHTDVDMRPEMRGFLACYSPNYTNTISNSVFWSKTVSRRIDGYPLAGDDLLRYPKNWLNPPDRFFERDEFMFTKVSFGQ